MCTAIKSKKFVNLNEKEKIFIYKIEYLIILEYALSITNIL